MQGPSHLHPALPSTKAYHFFHPLACPLAFWARFILLQAQPQFLLELLDATTASTITQDLDHARVFSTPSLVSRDVVMGKTSTLRCRLGPVSPELGCGAGKASDEELRAA